MESMVVIELDDDEKIIKLQDKWNAEEPKGFMVRQSTPVIKSILY